jgi:hypothetical protein
MPSLVPNQESPLYFVLCDYGPKVGRAYNEVDPDKADRETVVQYLMHGEFKNPQRVIEVDLNAGTSKDVTREIFDEVEEQRERAEV